MTARLASLALLTGLVAAVLAAVLMRGRVQIVDGVSSPAWWDAQKVERF